MAILRPAPPGTKAIRGTDGVAAQGCGDQIRNTMRARGTLVARPKQ